MDRITADRSHGDSDNNNLNGCSKLDYHNKTTHMTDYLNLTGLDFSLTTQQLRGAHSTLNYKIPHLVCGLKMCKRRTIFIIAPLISYLNIEENDIIIGCYLRCHELTH